MGHIELVQREPDQTFQLSTRQAVCTRVSLSKTKVYDLIREGRFPKAHQIEPGIRRWRSDDVEAWIEARAPRSRSGSSHGSREAAV